MTRTSNADRYLTPERGMPVLLAPAEVAERLRVSTQTLAEWRSKKRGPKHQPVGARVFYRESDVKDWLDREQDEAAS